MHHPDAYRLFIPWRKKPFRNCTAASASAAMMNQSTICGNIAIPAAG
jgi:hypothetical protein